MMSTGQKVLCGVLVLVIAGFAAAVGLGARQGDGNADSGRTGLVRLLNDLIGGGAQVAAGDVEAPDCPPDAAGVLTVPGRCVLRVAAGKPETRRLTMRAQNPLTVTAPVARQDYAADTRLAAGDEATVAVESGGAEITVACAAATTCAVTLVRGR